MTDKEETFAIERALDAERFTMRRQALIKRLWNLRRGKHGEPNDARKRVGGIQGEVPEPLGFRH